MGREAIHFLSLCQAGGERVSKAPCICQRAAQPKEQRRPTQLSALSPPKGKMFSEPSMYHSVPSDCHLPFASSTPQDSQRAGPKPLTASLHVHSIRYEVGRRGG